MSEKNMSLWSAMCVTPKEHAKPSLITQHDGTRLTLVKSQYRLQKLTEIFGPVGQGWGWEVVERWIDTWGTVACAYVSIKVWYVVDGKRFETGIQIGGTIAGENVDNIWKSSITDGIAKCAASLGLCSDAYMGEFADENQQRGHAGMLPEPVFGSPKENNLVQEQHGGEPKPIDPEPPKSKMPSPAPSPAAKPVADAAPPRPSTCPKCKSHVIAIGRGGNPNRCWDCQTKFDNNGSVA